MAFAPAFLDELRARTTLAGLIGRRARLIRSGPHWKACCPFHEEKTPSFYVYEDHFHCYGCGAHGDAISFVMQSQGAGFSEAVEVLAAEAGLEVPKPSPAAIEAERRRHDLYAVLAAAEAGFSRRLWLPEGQAALAYLRSRGLEDETIRGFGLGAVTMPVMEIVRVGRSALDGDPVEVTEYVIPSDRVETVHELHRDESAAWPWPEDAS